MASDLRFLVPLAGLELASLLFRSHLQRLGEPILTLNLAPTAVRSNVSAGRVACRPPSNVLLVVVLALNGQARWSLYLLQHLRASELGVSAMPTCIFAAHAGPSGAKLGGVR
jgi:hypothetical protein